MTREQREDIKRRTKQILNNRAFMIAQDRSSKIEAAKKNLKSIDVAKLLSDVGI